jgi:hypothetical protein
LCFSFPAAAGKPSKPGLEDDSLYRNSVSRIFGPDLTAPFDPSGGAVGVASVYGGVRVVPGDPEASVLFTKVKDEPLPQNLGWPMPRQFERLTPEETQTLRDWISEGAKNK